MLEALTVDGACYIIGRRAQEQPAIVAKCFESCRHFFARPLQEKALHGIATGPGQQHGYMSYLDDAEGSECFEAKVHHDQRFIWPEKPKRLRSAVEAALQLSVDTSLDALDALVEALPPSIAHHLRTHLPSVLDVARSPAAAAAAAAATSLVTSSSPVDLSAASHSAMRIWMYTQSEPSGWHCDNTLLTLAPPASVAGLLVRTLDGATLYPEEGMEEGEMLLFAGDALSYLTHGMIPALMHRVVPRPLAAAPPSAVTRPSASTPASTPAACLPRVSAPFFLRGRRGAVLSPLPPLPPLSVAVLEHNAGNLRSAWPWKRDGPLRAYYQGVQWHEESEADKASFEALAVASSLSSSSTSGRSLQRA
jgi:isopenicillin N synthase-like dioxygenase